MRQLEALVRVSEALAKMKLQQFATEEDVDEAIRLFKVGLGAKIFYYVICLCVCVFTNARVIIHLFAYSHYHHTQVSTLEAALSGHGEGDAGQDHFSAEEMMKLEQAVKRKFPVGTRVSETRLISDFVQKQVCF